MTNMNNPPFAALRSAIALSNDTGFRHEQLAYAATARRFAAIALSNDTDFRREQLAYAATARRFLDVSRAYLARRPPDFALEIRHLSSGVCALPSTGPRHPVQQFQIGGEHVAR